MGAALLAGRGRECCSGIRYRRHIAADFVPGGSRQNLVYSLAISMGLIFILSSGRQILLGPTVEGIPKFTSGGMLVMGGFPMSGS